MKARALLRVDELMAGHPELEGCRGDMVAALECLTGVFRSGGRLFVCGNGGSCADAFHVTGELMKSFALPRPLAPDFRERLAAMWPQEAEFLLRHLQAALPVQSLCGEAALISAYANDEAAELVFAQQVLGLGRAGDALLAVSTSGRSKNVVQAARVARAAGLSVVALAGRDGGDLARMADVAVVVPGASTWEIQERHLPVYHALCLALEEEFFGGDR